MRIFNRYRYAVELLSMLIEFSISFLFFAFFVRRLWNIDEREFVYCPFLFRFVSLLCCVFAVTDLFVRNDRFPFIIRDEMDTHAAIHAYTLPLFVFLSEKEAKIRLLAANVSTTLKILFDIFSFRFSVLRLRSIKLKL